MLPSVKLCGAGRLGCSEGERSRGAVGNEGKKAHRHRGIEAEREEMRDTERDQRERPAENETKTESRSESLERQRASILLKSWHQLILRSSYKPEILVCIITLQSMTQLFQFFNLVQYTMTPIKKR